MRLLSLPRFPQLNDLSGRCRLNSLLFCLSSDSLDEEEDGFSLNGSCEYVFLIAAILMMSVGYAALASQLNINGTSGITGNFKVQFTDITEGVAVGSATNKTAASVTDTTATFDVEFVSPGDSMTYKITVKNTFSFNYSF